MNTTLNIRISDTAKIEASEVLASIGLDMSSAVKMFLKQVVLERGLPFISTSNPARLRAKWDKELNYAMGHNKKYGTAKDALADI